MNYRATPALRQIRETRGLSLTALAVATDVAITTLSAIEHGQRSPSREVRQRVCAALGIDQRAVFAPVMNEDEVTTYA